MNPAERFRKESETNVARIGADLDLQALSRVWVRETNRYKWSYNFAWMGRPAIQFPNDMAALQRTRQMRSSMCSARASPICLLSSERVSY